MGLKKKSKVSAEFNMSSLTDIIFLLLIFFMLTSSLVVPNALNLKLPGRTSTKTQINTEPFKVTINRSGDYFLNGKRISAINLEGAVARLKRQRRGGEVSMTISPDPNTSNEHVVRVMDIAYRYGVTAVLL
ncbi:ExbD/TolR family protein [Portibacter marinus]|uniref:ExbD/TolR family protein n=1 Tax=Portibacter marinus TaxID=2898660 RepID=UPI001F239086|nr:biopolymer transporter ExbD [Portibacter marinus]